MSKQRTIEIVVSAVLACWIVSLLKRGNVQSPLQHAKRALLKGPPPAKGGYWATDLSLQELTATITKAMLGIPGQTDGDPFWSWLLSRCDNCTVTFREEAMFFYFVHYPMSYRVTSLFQSMDTGVSSMDLSIKNVDGRVVSTMIVVESLKRSSLGLWWSQHVCSPLIDVLLTWNLWLMERWAGKERLPLFVKAEEWKEARNDFKTKLSALESVWYENEPGGTYWYLEHLVTDPEFQGGGYASELMRKICELSDVEKVDLYLDCGSIRLSAFYQKFGFEIEKIAHLDEKEFRDQDADRESAAEFFIMRRRPKLLGNK